MKRILSFDGGGIRGVFSLQVAARVEALFRQAHGRPDLVLADVVDLFAGTSTGAIIAAFLAWGYPVGEVERLYVSHGRQMFARQWVGQFYKARYRAERVAGFFQDYFREDDGTPALLSSAKLRKLLLVVMANATTGSPWPVSSNPAARFNDPALDDCNLRVPIWQLLRASTAAPTYFQPEAIRLGSQSFLFVDGGITPYNNPALLATLMATLPCYRLEWPTGPDRLHLTSIGTGQQRSRYRQAVAGRIYLWNAPGFVIGDLMGTIGSNQDLLCRVLGRCLHGASIDAEVGCLDAPALLAASEQKFAYARYNVALDSPQAVGGVAMTPQELRLDNLHAIGRLQQVGRAYAEQTVRPEHLGLDRPTAR